MTFSTPMLTNTPSTSLLCAKTTVNTPVITISIQTTMKDVPLEYLTNILKFTKSNEERG